MFRTTHVIRVFIKGVYECSKTFVGLRRYKKRNDDVFKSKKGSKKNIVYSVWNENKADPLVAILVREKQATTGSSASYQPFSRCRNHRWRWPNIFEKTSMRKATQEASAAPLQNSGLAGFPKEPLHDGNTILRQPSKNSTRQKSFAHPKTFTNWPTTKFYVSSINDFSLLKIREIKFPIYFVSFRQTEPERRLVLSAGCCNEYYILSILHIFAYYVHFFVVKYPINA